MSDSFVTPWTGAQHAPLSMGFSGQEYWSGEGEGGTNGESSLDIYTLPYIKQIASGNLPYDSGNSNGGSGTAERGGMG